MLLLGMHIMCCKKTPTWWGDNSLLSSGWQIQLSICGQDEIPVWGSGLLWSFSGWRGNVIPWDLFEWIPVGGSEVCVELHQSWLFSKDTSRKLRVGSLEAAGLRGWQMVQGLSCWFCATCLSLGLRVSWGIAFASVRNQVHSSGLLPAP